jgi:hypothetical protein
MRPESTDRDLPWPALRVPRWLRALLAAAGALGIYALVGYQLVPCVARDYAIGYVREQFGRTLSIGALRFDPFLLELEIDQLALPDRQGPLLRFAFLRVDFELLASAWRRAYVFRDITLERPQLHAQVRKDGSLNLADFASKQNSPGDGELPALAIDSLTLHDGALSFSDLSHEQPFAQQLSPLSFQLKHFRTSAEGGAFALSAVGEQGARFWWKGDFAVSPALSSHGRIAIADVQLASLAKYVGSPVELEHGRGSFSLSYAIGPGASATLHDALLSDLTLASRAKDRVIIPVLRIHDARVDLPARQIVVEAVRVVQLHTRAILDADGVNLARLAPAPSTAGGPAWSFKLARFDLERASATLEDRSVEPAIHAQLSALDVAARDITQDGALPIPISIAAAFGRDGSLRVAGDVTPASSDAQLTIALDDLRVPLAQPYLQPYASLSVDDGALSVAGKLTRKQGKHSFEGSVTLRDLHTRDPVAQREFVSVPALTLHDVRYRDQPASLAVAKVSLQNPSARVVLNANQTLNVSEVMKVAHGKATPSRAEPLAIEIGEVVIDGMRLDFSDFYIQPNFALDLRNVRGSVKGLSTDPKSRARVALRGILGESAPVQIQGQLLPFAYDAATDLELAWQNVPLPVFNPYSGRFAGYNIVRGDLASTVRYQVRNGKLDAQHHVRVDQLTWGDETDTKQSATLPVRLATALLRDRNGVISLDVPVQGDLHDPKFRVWPIVKQVLVNVAVKAVTAPFDFLGSLFSGAEKARFVAFRPGESALEPSERSQLDALAQALAERPSLALDVPLGVDPKLDREALIERKFQLGLAETIPRELWGDKKHAGYASLADDDRIDVLEALYERLSGESPKLPEPPPAPDGSGFRDRRRLKDAFKVSTLEQMTRAVISVDPAELEELGLARANAIERALTEGGKIDGHRVLVSNQGKVESDRGKVRFELALH